MGSDGSNLSAQLSKAAPAALAAALEAVAQPPLERRLRELIDQARAANPGVSLSDREFLRHLAPRLPAGAPLKALGALEGADLYLACGCARHLPAALALFEARVLPRVKGVLRRQDSSDSYVDEVLQLLRQKLLVGDGPGALPKILEYQGKGPLEAWVRAAAIRVGLNSRRGFRPDLSGDEALLQTPEAGMDPEMAAIRRRSHAEFKSCFQQAMGQLTGEERNILRLHLIEGVGIEKVASLVGIHRTTVTRRLAQSRNALLQETRRLLIERLRLSRAELDSMVKLLRGQLDLSISRELRGAGEP